MQNECVGIQRSTGFPEECEPEDMGVRRRELREVRQVAREQARLAVDVRSVAPACNDSTREVLNAIGPELDRGQGFQIDQRGAESEGGE
jgi:hypothetical protein